MNRYVADPHWHDYIIWYFFLGGIAAGAYAMAMLARLFGGEPARRGTRAAEYLAFPLVSICGVLLVVDLGRPERFWHMLIASETFRPMFKWWSPMSVGSWGLSVFGLFAGLSFLGVLIEDGAWGSDRLRARVVTWRRGVGGQVAAVIGAASAFFLGSYTGVLLAVTNQPIWSDSTWLGPLFLASSASTGTAAILLSSRRFLNDVDHEMLKRLEALDLWAVVLEAALLVAFVTSLGDYARPAIGRGSGLLIPAVVFPFGILIPIVFRTMKYAWISWATPLSVLLGGFALRASIVGMPGLFRLGG